MGRRTGPVDETGTTTGRLVGPLVVLLLLAWLAWAFVPPVWTSFQLRQAMQDETLYGPVDEAPSRIQSRLLAVARRHGLTLERQQIRVEKRGPLVQIDAGFTVPVDFGGGLVWKWGQQASYEGTRRPGARRGP